MNPVRHVLKQGLAIAKDITASRNTKAFLGIGLTVVLAWAAIQCRLGHAGSVFAQGHTDTAAITIPGVQ